MYLNRCLYISNFLNNSGYSEAATNSAKALHALNYPLVCRNINLTRTLHQDNQIQHLCSKNASDCNILLIHSLPEFTQYDRNFKKCIIRFDWEADNLNTMNWIKHLKLMDEIWVSCTFEKNILMNEGMENIRIIPHCVDINRFNHSMSLKGRIHRLKEQTGNYVFYTIGEYVARKNYEGLLRAWHSHFSIYDGAELVIKTNDSKILELNEHVKRNVKVNRRWLKEPVFITERLSSTDLDLLHIESDCFVMPSHGEGFSYPCVDAMSFGKPVIVSNYSSFLDYVDESNGFLINGSLQDCYGTMDTARPIYNGYQQWFEPNPSHLGYLMKKLVKDPELGVHKGTEGRQISERFSYENVGNAMIDLLEAP